jgi:hypothetical protein
VRVSKVIWPALYLFEASQQFECSTRKDFAMDYLSGPVSMLEDGGRTLRTCSDRLTSWRQ